ncbi:hypothetical protein AAW51_4577 [Caldimonas brevitalea]|uniref:Major facilitator superfamily (MFS) profile domain-containing protein n=1 Tax=Caldimonas brevitalea TaxID=413882 RepID=A0A0G3BTF8_9BURK|nr:hypothetical protein AAW51_4577 [Caldimonas brevitalea]
MSTARPPEGSQRCTQRWRDRSSHSHRPSARTGWPAVLTVVAAGTVTAVHLGKVAMVVPQLQQELGLSLTEVGALGAMFALLGALASVPAGTLVAAAGDRRMLVLGLAVMALGGSLGAQAVGLGLLLVSRVVEGLGFLLVTVAGPMVLRRVVSPAQLNRAFALWSCFMPAGLAAVMLVSPWFDHWRVLWWAVVAVTGLVLAAIGWWVPAPRRAAGALLSGAPKPASSGAGPDLPRIAFALAASFLCYSLMFFALGRSGNAACPAPRRLFNQHAALSGSQNAGTIDPANVLSTSLRTSAD